MVDAPDPEPDVHDLLAFDPVTAEGSGDDVVVHVPVVEDVPLVATVEDAGSRNFAVESYDQTGDRLNLMVNTIGAYGGTVPYNFESSPAEPDITADGAWTVTISALVEQPALTDAAEGSSDDVLWLQTDGRLSTTHDGERNFALRSWGERRDLLVNEIGPYDGPVRLGSGGLALEITANGHLTVDVG